MPALDANGALRSEKSLDADELPRFHHRATDGNERQDDIRARANVLPFAAKEVRGAGVAAAPANAVDANIRRGTEAAVIAGRVVGIGSMRANGVDAKVQRADVLIHTMSVLGAKTPVLFLIAGRPPGTGTRASRARPVGTPIVHRAKEAVIAGTRKIHIHASPRARFADVLRACVSVAAMGVRQTCRALVRVLVAIGRFRCLAGLVRSLADAVEAAFADGAKAPVVTILVVWHGFMYAVFIDAGVDGTWVIVVAMGIRLTGDATIFFFVASKSGRAETRNTRTNTFSASVESGAKKAVVTGSRTENVRTNARSRITVIVGTDVPIVTIKP